MKLQFTRARSFAVALATLALLFFPPAVASSANESSREQRWREDLAFFYKELPAKEKDFYLLKPRSTFDAEIAALNQRLPQLSDPDIIFSLCRIVASLHIAHTRVDVFSGNTTRALRQYPIRMKWFSDGLAVIAAAPEHEAIIGSRVIRIGSAAPERVQATLAAYIPHESITKLRANSPGYMNFSDLMARERFADTSGQIQLTCAKPNGETVNAELAPASAVENSRNMVTAERALNIPALFCKKNPKAFYWYEYLPEKQTLYIQYSKCIDEPGNAFADFAAKLFAFCDSHPVQRVIVDLRFNGGGSSQIVQPLIAGLKSRPNLTRKGHLYALIGPYTFSSAMFAAVDLRQVLHAILIGEPTGNKPNHYGQTDFFVLPNSKLSVYYCTKVFRIIKGADPAALVPDLAVPVSLKDYLAGQDPALDAALKHPLQ